MAQERSLSPEKQLLKLIEEPKAGGGGIQAEAVKHQGLSMFSPSAWLGRFFFFRDTFKKYFHREGPAQLDIKLINRALSFMILLLVFYFLSTFAVSLLGLKKVPRLEFKASAASSSVSPQEILSLKKAAAYYLEKVTERDIFKMGEKKADKSAAAGSKPPSSRIMEATQHLKLVGISWSNDPDAMIEDSKAGRTFFMKRGQMLGEIKVQAIFKDKVVLGYEGEEIELR